jgi:hypothetical protein
MRPMNACERAVWEDAEGCFYFNSLLSMYRIRTFQKERSMLEAYRLGADLDGVVCRVIVEPRKKTRHFPYNIVTYYSEISGIVNVAKELEITAPWRRHPEKIRRIEELKRMLATPKKRVKRKMIEAELKLRDLQYG